MSTSSWVKDIQDRVKKASNDVNFVLQPRVAQAKRSIEASIQQIGLKPGREIFDGDDALYDTLTDLDNLRIALREIALSVEQYRARLLELSRSQSALSMHLQRPPHDILLLMRKHVPQTHIETQLELSNAQVFSANSMSRFALDMSTPMADLSRKFDETYDSKITPLKKRYISQKKEYITYSRQAAAADDSIRRENLTSIADSAAWQSTGETLLSEIRSLLSYSLSHLSEWILNVAQAQREMFSRSARAFEGPANRAEAAQNESSPST